MNTANMPGFTAESSLYVSRTQYNVTVRHYYQNHQLNSTSLVQGNVVPQLKKVIGKYCDIACGFFEKLSLEPRYCGNILFDTEKGVIELGDKSPFPEHCYFGMEE